MKDTAITVDSRFAAPISEQIWNMKYRLQGQDDTVEDTWRRIADDLASCETDPILWADRFYQVIEDFVFLPAGRITAGAGTGRDVTLFNCFVMGTVPDSMAGIMDMLKEAALTMQQGGGIGYDFSTIRPKGAFVAGVAADASGPLTFMDVWDSACKTIMSAGSRRGAMMATMRCDHPDVKEFIVAKRDPLRLRNFNLSVLVTDPFMAAVEADADWELVFKGRVYETIRARELWDMIMESTYAFAEPGVIFIDRINETNNLRYCEVIAATNPCGEQPLPPYGACLLGSINLARLISAPFTTSAELDMKRLITAVEMAIRMMDNVVDVSKFPLPEQEQEAKNKRRLGLGVTGVADALLMLGLRYGSDEAAQWVAEMMASVDHIAYNQSVNLAIEKGPFPLFDADEFLRVGTHASNLEQSLQDRIRTHGIRNSHLTSIAPTGTISLYAGNVSSGIEPVFAYSYTRKVTQKDGTKTEEEVVDYAVQIYREMFGEGAPLPDHFVNAQTLPPLEHVKMQAAAQRWVDSSISKTINCPEDISFEDFKAVYIEAYRTGCKGCTTYRPNDVTGSVLSVTPSPEATIAAPTIAIRPVALVGKTYKLKWPSLAHAFYVTINDTPDGKPFEIFITTQNIEAQAWITTLARMISAVFRRGGDVSFVAEELQQIFDPQGGAWVDGKYVNSLIAAIGGVIADHTGVVTKAVSGAKACPSCAEQTLIKMSGCETCSSCGFSKCG